MTERSGTLNAADHTVSTLALKHAVRDGIARSAVVIGLGGIALIHWLEPLGLASLFVEAGVVGVSGLVLLDRARVTGGRPVLEAYAHA